MIARQPLDESNIDRIAAALIEKHHPLRIILAVWLAARERRRRKNAVDIALMNLSDRMRRDMGLPEEASDPRGAPIDIFKIKI
ncbi:hypothetical protein M2360_002060 [Rhizobium sp. SG_E_25_P2]|uniref:hypothetical protein n=1 Tax=Rhizobium sp. SG_E_25_P2 TaxID=2879942 RepID=UPI0024735CAB|nr:hypothetical protein [Rhizobium sp. SG_E_25_P2]MDH6266664.1 hypothetical protein [Rhizobium sp. SG_E_25_P2]